MLHSIIMEFAGNPFSLVFPCDEQFFVSVGKLMLSLTYFFNQTDVMHRRSRLIYEHIEYVNIVCGNPVIPQPTS